MDCLFTGRQLLKLQSVDSTNRFAMQMTEQGRVAEGLVIWTRDQYEGRGQRGSIWVSEKGENLTFSIVYSPVFLLPEKQFYLNMAISLGMLDFIKSHHKDGHIKWPNDLMIGHKKCGGILIENVIRGNQLSYSVIGIGLNINQRKFPEELTNATSLALECKTGFDPEKMMYPLLKAVENRYLMLRSGFFKQLKSNYLQQLYGYGIQRSYLAAGKKFTGTISDVSETGKLIIKTDKDEVREFGFKEVQLVQETK